MRLPAADRVCRFLDALGGPEISHHYTTGWATGFNARRPVQCSAGLNRTGDLTAQANTQRPGQQGQRDETEIWLDRSEPGERA